MEYSEKQLNGILAKWGMHGDSFKLIERGYVNYNWLVEAWGERYILRQATFLNPKDFPFEVDYISQLRKAGFPYRMPVAIRTTEGKLLVEYRGKSFWLYKYIEGEIKHRSALQRRDFAEVAKLYAIYHKALIKAGLCKRIEDPFRANAVSKSIVEDLSELKKDRKMNASESYFSKNAMNLLKLYRKLDKNAYLRLPAYHLHQDINDSNILWKGSRIVGVLDFENVSNGAILIRDFVALFPYAFKDKRRDYQIDLRKAADFLKVYSRYRRPGSDEIKLMPDVLIAGMLEDFEFNYWTLSHRPDKKVGLKDLQFNVKAIKWYDRSRKQIIRALLDAMPCPP